MSNLSTGATVLVFVIAYVAVTGLSLPGAAAMTLAGGAIFGLLWGTVLASFASTAGATLAFLASRFLLRACGIEDRHLQELCELAHALKSAAD